MEKFKPVQVDAPENSLGETGTQPHDEVLADGAMQHFSLTVDKFLLHAAKWHPATQVVTGLPGGETRRSGYAVVLENARRVSAILATLGVARGDRVATLAWNSQEHLEAWYGIMGMGAACHTLNPRLTPDQLGTMVRSSGARVLIVSADLMPLTRQIVDNARRVSHVLVIDGSADTWPEGTAQPAVRILNADDPSIEANVPWGQFDENCAAGLCFTSGTTGAPKGVSYTHRSNYLHTMRLLQTDVLGLSAQDTILGVVPMFHASAWGLPFAAPAAGAKLVLPGRAADGASLERLINGEGVTIGAGVPTVWLGLLEHLEKTGGQVPTLKRVVVGGSPMPPALMERLAVDLGVETQTSWGMTELSPSGTMARPNEPNRQASVSGKPALGMDLLLTDANGKALPEQRDVEGHLRVRGAAVIERYLGQSESATDADGWFETGDLARIGQDGSLMITGRSKDLIKSGGEWINPAEMEAVVGAHPEVSQVAVIGRADPKWGERPILIVEMREGSSLSDAELLDTLRNEVASWWIPDAVLRISRMPLAPTGKIDKMRLRSQYASA
ncbi:AMP-binding protein [Roseibium sp.]|uniref:AMP-binding protein n=1 Tax=Roseibium sp. TaxID=1936156 RepID=UPI003A97FBE9